MVDKSHERAKREKRQQMKRDLLQKSLKGIQRPEMYVGAVVLRAVRSSCVFRVL